MADYTDDFNRTDGDPGVNWVDCLGTGLFIDTNRLTHWTSTASYGSLYNQTLTNDQYAEATVLSPGSSRYFSVGVRMSGADATLDGYVGVVGGTNEYYISRYDNGSSSDVASGTTTFSDGSTVRVEISGSTITLKVDGGTVATYSSATEYTSGKAALILYREATDAYFDNFGAGDLGGSSGQLLKQVLLQQ